MRIESSGARSEREGAKDGEATARGRAAAEGEWLVTKERQRTQHQTWVPTVTSRVLAQSVPNVATRFLLGNGVRLFELRRTANHEYDRRDPPRLGQVGSAGAPPLVQSTPDTQNHSQPDWRDSSQFFAHDVVCRQSAQLPQ